MAPPWVEFTHPLQVSASTYWEISQSDAYRHYMAGLDGNVLTTKSLTESTCASGHRRVVRVSKMVALHNPVPKSIRKVGGLGHAACRKLSSPSATDRRAGLL